jgi:alpha-beta hydrolase superfamily lysophospholipase
MKECRKRLRAFFRWSAVIVGVWLVLCVAIGIVAEEWALHPWRRALGPEAEARAQAVAQRNHAVLIEVSITAADGVTLRGWSIRPVAGNGDAVILLHGHADNRLGMLRYADLLLRHGYAVLLPDARAHGKSGGELATYGLKETGDVRRWFDWVERTESPRCIDGLGNSMGAGLLLESLRTMQGFCAVVAESPFADFREASYDRLGEWAGTGPWIGRTLMRPAVEVGLLDARWIHGIDLEQVSPENAVVGSRVPILLIHGKADTKLPVYNSERIQAHNSAIVLWEPANAGHCGAIGTEPEEYERRVIGWFASHDASRPDAGQA